MKLHLVAALFISWPGIVAAQAPSCSTDLAGARSTIEADYGGVRLGITGKRKPDYERLYARLQKQADSTSGDCFPVLDAFAASFQDPHLFIYQTVRLDSAESARRAQAVRMAPITEEAARAYLTSRGRQLDPIEGIWSANRLRLAVVPDSAGGPGHSIARRQEAD